MKNYCEEVLDKKTNKKTLEFVKYPGSIDYWRMVIKKDNVGANCVLATFEFDSYSNQIIMTNYKLSSLNRTINISLIKDKRIINSLNKRLGEIW